MAITKTHEALVAEMLGDIGKLHDQVADLKVELPGILGQMQAVIAAQTAKAQVLQEPTQRAIQSFVRQELKGISVAVKEAKTEVLNEFEMEVVAAVRKNLIWMQGRSDQAFDVATKQFNNALVDSAKLAESSTTERLNGLCTGLKRGIDEIRAEKVLQSTERWQGHYLSMLGVCMSTGLVVGALAVILLK